MLFTVYFLKRVLDRAETHGNLQSLPKEPLHLLQPQYSISWATEHKVQNLHACGHSQDGFTYWDIASLHVHTAALLGLDTFVSTKDKAFLTDTALNIWKGTSAGVHVRIRTGPGASRSQRLIHHVFTTRHCWKNQTGSFACFRNV